MFSYSTLPKDATFHLATEDTVLSIYITVLESNISAGVAALYFTTFCFGHAEQIASDQRRIFHITLKQVTLNYITS